MVNDLLHRPLAILWICLTLAFVNLVVDGTLFRLWTLHRDFSQVLTQKLEAQKSLTEIQAKIRVAGDPAFLEREARTRFDLVSEGDLVFVFADDELK